MLSVLYRPAAAPREGRLSCFRKPDDALSEFSLLAAPLDDATDSLGKIRDRVDDEMCARFKQTLFSTRLQRLAFRRREGVKCLLRQAHFVARHRYPDTPHACIATLLDSRRGVVDLDAGAHVGDR